MTQGKTFSLVLGIARPVSHKRDATHAACLEMSAVREGFVSFHPWDI